MGSANESASNVSITTDEEESKNSVFEVCTFACSLNLELNNAIKRTECYCSNEGKKCKWLLQLELCKNDINEKTTKINVVLTPAAPLTRTIFSDIEIKVLDSKKEKTLFSDVTYSAFSPYFENYDSFSKSVEEEILNKVEEKVLHLHIKVSARFGYLQLPYYSENEKFPGIFARDFSDMLAKKIHCDIEILVGSTSLFAHRSILASSSPVFANLIEVHKNSIKIVEFKENVVSEMLSFIYTGKLPSCDISVVSSLLAASECYELKDLKFACENALAKLLDSSNAIDILNLCDKHSAFYLREVLIDYISWNAGNLINKENSRELSKLKPETLSDILQAVTSGISALSVSHDGPSQSDLLGKIASLLGAKVGKI